MKNNKAYDKRLRYMRPPPQMYRYESLHGRIQHKYMFRMTYDLHRLNSISGTGPKSDLISGVPIYDDV